jgi:anti-anti-sigma regulatory factor
MLTSTTHIRADATVIRLSGVLNARTYQQVRDSVINVAIDQSTAVIVDINDLEVRDDQSWAVFTSARWHVQQWPEVPIALVYVSA